MLYTSVESQGEVGHGLEREDVISPEEQGLGIQAHQIEFNLALTHFKYLLSQ